MDKIETLESVQEYTTNIVDLVKNFKYGLKDHGPFLIEVMI
mgnify:CR=1 FL=1